jgi:hypothetical protein
VEWLSKEIADVPADHRPGRFGIPVEDLAAAVLSASSSLKVNLPGVGEATLPPLIARACSS